MFFGTHERNLDDKGRIAIPARFREQLPSGSVITVAPDSCLRVYPPAEWDRMTGQTVMDSATTPAARSLARKLFAAAAPVEFDGQGRTLLPANLRDRAGIAGAAVVVGVNNVVEIWSPEGWEAEQAARDLTDLADEVAGNH